MDDLKNSLEQKPRKAILLRSDEFLCTFLFNNLKECSSLNYGPLYSVFLVPTASLANNFGRF